MAKGNQESFLCREDSVYLGGIERSLSKWYGRWIGWAGYSRQWEDLEYKIIVEGMMKKYSIDGIKQQGKIEFLGNRMNNRINRLYARWRDFTWFPDDSTGQQRLQ